MFLANLCYVLREGFGPRYAVFLILVIRKEEAKNGLQSRYRCGGNLY